MFTGPWWSAEVTATDAPTMIKEGRKLAAIADNVAVKVPLTEEGLMACGRSDAGTMVNVTVLLPLKLSWRRRQGQPLCRPLLAGWMI